MLQPGVLHPEPLPMWQATADLYLHRRHSNPQRQVWLSLCGVSWCIQDFVWALRASLAGMGFDSKCDFAPPTILLGFLLCPWMWGILCHQRWRNSIQWEKTRLEADCGSGHELLIAKFRLKLKKVGKTTRSFKCGLNQIPYDYTVEVIQEITQNFLSYHLYLVHTEYPRFSHSVHLPDTVSCNTGEHVLLDSPAPSMSRVKHLGHWLGLLRLCICTCTHMSVLQKIWGLWDCFVCLLFKFIKHSLYLTTIFHSFGFPHFLVLQNMTFPYFMC